MADLKPVKDWTTYDEAYRAVQADLPKDYETCRAMIEDHEFWGPNGEGWLGHRTGDSVVDSAMRDRIKPQFVADDVSGELIENRTNGLIGQEADTQLQLLEPLADDASDEEKQAADDDAESGIGALAVWWDREQYWERVAEATGRVSYARRAGVRPFVADADMLDGRLPTGQTLAGALAIIHIDAPLPSMATRYIDPSTQRPAVIVLDKVVGTDGQETDRASVWTVNPETKQTEVKVFQKGGTEPKTFPVNLGGRLPFGEMRGKRILTEPLRRIQALLNFIVTVTGRTVEMAGFRSVHVTNAEPHLLWLQSKPQSTPVVRMLDANNVETQKPSEAVLYGVATPPMIGAGVLNEWQGIRSTEVVSGGTAETFMNPSITALEPVDPTALLLASDAVRSVMYKRAKQGHLSLDATVQASGTAYQQARAQHEADLRRLKGSCEGMIRDSLEAVLALAAEMSDEAKALLARFRLVVNLRISAGPITTEDANTAILLRDKGAISNATMQHRVGVEDPQAETQAIQDDPLYWADFYVKIIPAWNALTATTSVEKAAELLHLTPEQAAALDGMAVAAQAEPPIRAVA